eukprot:10489680-Alexandrium_andersonii.AAC.1
MAVAASSATCRSVGGPSWMGAGACSAELARNALASMTAAAARSSASDESASKSASSGGSSAATSTSSNVRAGGRSVQGCSLAAISGTAGLVGVSGFSAGRGVTWGAWELSGGTALGFFLTGVTGASSRRFDEDAGAPGNN